MSEILRTIVATPTQAMKAVDIITQIDDMRAEDGGKPHLIGLQGDVLSQIRALADRMRANRKDCGDNPNE